MNVLTRGDSRPTPLILAIAYDWLAEDTLGVADVPRTRSNIPFSWVTGGEDDVWQTTLVLAWRDDEFNNSVNARDELSAGLVMVNRGQDSTASNIYIGDFFYRILWSAFGRRAPQLYSEGELYTIQGVTNAVGLFGAIDPTTGRSSRQGGADIWGGVARLGLEDPMWSARFEAGFSTGQPGGITTLPANPDATTFAQRPSNSAYQVGLLLFPTVLAVRTANAYTDTFQALWSNGGVWNSVYFLPQVRVRPLPGLELIGQFILAYADELDVALSNPGRDVSDTACLLDGERCLLGWEADFALRVHWGPNDEMRWSNELGIMNAGPALGPKLSQSFLWTLQSRIAFLF
ncbi:MAG: hypothetical protein M5U28_49775 [Sandaracinaceae bacterium]|nr:hypothetical protein [Sandaracinaceae bacterium]